MEIMAESASSLLDQLSKLDINVPQRTKGRTQEHTERHTAAHLLAAIATTDLLDYPLIFKHRDKPDFSLSMNAETLGIEHTEAVPENHAHRTALRVKGHGSSTYFETPSRIGERKTSRRELIDEIERNCPGTAWIGNSVEREWAEAMHHFAMDKTQTALSPGFDRFLRQWLLIYDNWPVPAVDIEDAGDHLHILLADEPIFECFEKVFIMTERTFCEVREDGTSYHPVKRLGRGLSGM